MSSYATGRIAEALVQLKAFFDVSTRYTFQSATKYSAARFGIVQRLLFIATQDAVYVEKLHMGINLWTDKDMMSWKKSLVANCNSISVAVNRLQVGCLLMLTFQGGYLCKHRSFGSPTTKHRPDSLDCSCIPLRQHGRRCAINRMRDQSAKRHYHVQYATGDPSLVESGCSPTARRSALRRTIQLASTGKLLLRRHDV